MDCSLRGRDDAWDKDKRDHKYRRINPTRPSIQAGMRERGDIAENNENRRLTPRIPY